MSTKVLLTWRTKDLSELAVTEVLLTWCEGLSEVSEVLLTCALEVKLSRSVAFELGFWKVKNGEEKEPDDGPNKNRLGREFA